MPLISDLEVANTLKISKYGDLGLRLSKTFMSLLRLNKLNYIYDRYNHLKGLEFVDAVLLALGVEVIISENDLSRIPKCGPFVAIANHPLGAIDGLIMLKLLLTKNPNSKILGNFLLKRIDPISDSVCPVNPFETRKSIFSSITGIRAALQQLAKGNPLGIFPAGEVSSRQHIFYGPVRDKSWDQGMIKLIKKAQVPIVPIYFHARNSELFYLLAGIHPNLKTARLPKEMVHSRQSNIQVRIGIPISVKEQENINDLNEFGSMLRNVTYQLSQYFKKPRNNLLNNIRSLHKVTPIIKINETNSIIQYFENLRQKDEIILKSGSYEVYFVKLTNKPEIKKELGRLREITFRAVGEGTYKELDLDQYDDYYYHLILWDSDHKKIVGAYRMGLGLEIYMDKGIKGFYLSDLFNLSKKMHKIMSESIELGRAFITSEYQQKPHPLFLLWKGIVNVSKKFPQYKYLIGAASISNNYCKYSQSILVTYLNQHHLDPILNKLISPKKKFKSILNKKDTKMIKETLNENIKFIDKYIENLEPNGLKIPVLIKKYLMQNAKMIGFNVDPEFNNAIDGLMYIKIDDIESDSSLLKSK